MRTKRASPYTQKDFESGDGMLTAVWGPPMWHFLHSMSFNYPVRPTATQKKAYRAFILSLQDVLPCKHCRNNLRENFKKLPLTVAHMASRDSFSRYVYQLHELINRMLGKKSNLTFAEVRERYEHFRSRCLDSDTIRKLREKGCTEPLYAGQKSKCILRIVPHTQRDTTFRIDRKCLRTPL